MFRCAVFGATMVRRSGAAAARNPPTRAAALKDATSDAVAGCSAPNTHVDTSLQHAQEEIHATFVRVEKAPATQHHLPKFLFQGRRGSSSSEYYVSRSNPGHPDTVAELLGAGRADPEWMWLKLLCFLCVSSTFGTTLYSYCFAEHMKYFKDEPWSPFRH
ncbi:conserved hypothetical protein [Leishmania infantum JPCM5]|uniref:Uncharacterized protein n=2 Tax=Leishmania infantum TaxID=5671 RepID=A4I9X8_LEIIN|nr:conserved hypothetical protein [Leishmania infantum JPCM5]CAC9538438.1 hypothetical_protein_-_conserved [Leishmania infantum]CAM71632.1 conserved hypothetical protein [Leishmania infantum JPCM5]SUZ45558.1 hypothetical_protein_-_conserved [Leishmania infantum]|eukprot:XP_001468547.1 conserved hypothetical protein [Leishmania infantum JPCM5]